MARPIGSNHQVQPMTVVIRNICEQYPGGVTIPREMIQNSDDAGAQTVVRSPFFTSNHNPKALANKGTQRFVLDDRDHPTDNLMHPRLARFHGPALIVFNSAPFTDKDFENIKNTGTSYKKKDAFMTGRFGLGFNSVYNWTDMPSIVSRDQLVILDPHEWLAKEPIPGTSEYIGPSPRYNFVKDAGDAGIQAQMSTYNAVLSNSTKEFQGTAIRIPLRSKEQANESDIFNRETTVAEVRKALESFVGEFSSSGLLFMRNVETIIVESPKQGSTTIRITNVEEVRS